MGIHRCIAALVTVLSVYAADPSSVMNSKRAARDSAADTDPGSAFWRDAPAVVASGDTRGREVPGHRTEVRSRWTQGNLYFLFICPYEQLYLKPDPHAAEETNELWKWDVAEVFVGSDFKDINRYKEFEVSPQGEWVDLDIDLSKPHHEDGWVWNSGFQPAARIDAARHVWYCFMRIPWSAIDTRAVATGNQLRINLYYSQGPPGAHQGIAWRPTGKPTFHAPESFGTLKLVE